MRRLSRIKLCRWGHCLLASDRFISNEWQPHSEQLKSWIAVSDSDMRANAAARAYIYNLRIDAALKTLDDTVDLVLSMKKIQYPREGKAAEALRTVLDRTANNIEWDDIDHLWKLAAAHPEAAFDLFSVVLENDAVVRKIGNLFSEMPINALLQLSQAVWSVSQRHGAERFSAFFLCVAHHLATRLKTVDNPLPTLLQIVEACPPLDVTGLSELKAGFAKAITSLDCHDALLVLETMAKHLSLSNTGITILLQNRFTRMASSSSDLETARFFRALSTLQDAPTPELSVVVQLTVTRCSEDTLLLISDSVRTQLVINRQCPDLLITRDCITRRVNVDLRKQSLTAHSRIRLIACLSQINPAQAKRAFTSLDNQVEKEMTSVDVPHLLTITKNIDFCSRTVADLIQSYASAALRDPMRAYALYALTLCQTGPRETLLQESLSSRGLHKYGRRFKSHAPMSYAPNDEGTVFLLLSLLHCKPDGSDSTIQLLFAQWNPTRFEISVLLDHLNCVGISCAATAQCIVAAAIRHIDLLTGDEVHTILELMSTSHHRNVAAFEMVLKRLASLDLPFRTVLCAATCAQKLRLGAVLERTAIIDSIESLGNVTDHDVVRLLRACPSAQRSIILRLRPADSLVAELTLSTLDTSELMILFSVGNTKLVRQQLLVELQTRSTPTSDELLPEDVLSAVEAADRRDHLRELFRIGGRSLQSVDEGQLTRLYLKLKSMHQCPNVCFRVVGRALLRLADRLSVENALSWLSLYMAHNIRDDSVGKALIRKVNGRSGSLSRRAAKQLGEANRFFGLEPSKTPPKRSKRRGSVLMTQDKTAW